MNPGINLKQRDEVVANSTVDSQAGTGDGVRILVVDGSALMRRLLTRILETDRRFEVVGAARSVVDALMRIDYFRPNVLILNDEPRNPEELTATSAFAELYSQVRIVIRDAMDERCARLMTEALQSSTLPKLMPTVMGLRSSYDGEKFIKGLLQQVRHATQADSSESRYLHDEPGLIAGEPARATKMPKPSKPREHKVEIAPYPQALVIGSSTGGPAALSDMLSALPVDFPLPVLVVQHMPPRFTKMLADRLTKTCLIPFVEAEDGMEVIAGHGYIAPGDFHMGVTRRSRQTVINLSQDHAENSCRPAVDYLFRSVAETYVGASIAVILTGMGQDGLRGVRALKAKGVPVLVQDRSTSVVWGMPGAVAEAGLADYVLPINAIVPRILGLL